MSEPDIRVDDEEGTVDTKVKNQIMNLRAMVDKDERNLYVDRLSDPRYNLNVQACNQYWGISVRQYLRGIKRLWNESAASVSGVSQYWEQTEIGREKLVPPDTDDYQFSLVEHSKRYSELQLKRMIGLPQEADLPEVKTKTFNGLNDVLAQNRIEATWVVTIDTTGPPPEHEQVTVSTVEPVPKHILENAVEAADNFLQQAGVGFDVVAEPYTADGEPGI